MKKRKKGQRFTISAARQAPEPRAIALKSEDLAVYVRCREKKVLPILKERQLGPGSAQFLLAQQTQVLVTGDPRLTMESGMTIVNSVLALWQEGYYTPDQCIPTHLKRRCWSFRNGGSETKATLLYQRVRAQADGEPKQRPFDMISYLVEHLDHSIINL